MSAVAEKIDVDKLEAGRDLDQLIAKHVFGCNAWEYECLCEGMPHTDMCGRLLEYSKDISAAWQIVGFMDKAGRAVGIDRNGYTGQPAWDWEVCFPKGESPSRTTAYAPTVELAICRAALKAVQ